MASRLLRECAPTAFSGLESDLLSTGGEGLYPSAAVVFRKVVEPEAPSLMPGESQNRGESGV